MKRQSKADIFFSDNEKKRIKEAVAKAESRTIGEIAVMIIDESSRYREAEVLGGVIVASLASLIVTTLFFHESIWWYIPLSFLLFFPARFVFERFGTLKMYCISNKRKETAVKERALIAFYEKGLYKTRQNTGILFFLSILEHKVWVLADKGINEKMEQATLNRFAGQIAQGIRAGRACDSLVEAIGEAGNLLARHYPIQPGDTNELSNEIICQDNRGCD